MRLNFFKKILSVGWLLPLVWHAVSAQLVLNQPNTTGTYTNPVSITLDSGFTTTSFHAYIMAGGLPLNSNPSGNQNYIRTTTYLKPYTDPPGSPSTLDAMQNISYFDGLGRPLQQVQVLGVPLENKDLVIPVAYDAFGRQDRQYLPYATSTGLGGAFKAGSVAQQGAYYASSISVPPGQEVNSHPYSQTVFEPSPLNRVLQQGAPGQIWQPSGSRSAFNGRSVDTDYQSNNLTGFGDLAGTRKVALYQVTYSGGIPSLARNGDYGANQLYVTVTKDENWETSATGFNSRLHTTEEYTDKQGRVLLKRTFNLNNGTPEMLSTYYVYDDFGNLVFVLPPGINPDRDSGAPNQTELNQYAYQYRYDNRNRMSYRRLPGANEWDNYIYNMFDWLVFHQESRQHQNNTYGGAASGPYHTFYKYDAHGRVIMKGVEGGRTGSREIIQGYFAGHYYQWESRNTDPGHLHGYTNLSMPSATSTMDVTEVNYYDSYAGIPGLPHDASAGYSSMTQGLLVASKVKVLGTADTYLWTVNYYNDRGELVRVYKQNFYGGAASASNYEDVVNEYNFSGLLTKSTRWLYTTQTPGSAQLSIVTEYTYDHRNRLVDTWKTVNPGQGTRTLIARNEYNEVGQLRVKHLHSTNEGSSFGQFITYSYNPRGWLKKSDNGLFKQELFYEGGLNPQYNGNISRQTWLHAGDPSREADYIYDRLNRLTFGGSSDGKQEALRYDKQGNITYLQRDNGTAWNYHYSGNRLQNITGGINTGTYFYDDNGSMITDGRTGRGFTYNYLNLPKSVSGSPAITYTYDGSGRKLRTVNGGVATDYADGIEWQGGTLSVIHHEEGRIVAGGGGTYTYDYHLRDHLGNTRSEFAAGSTVTRKTDYYPFGMAYQSGVALSPNNRYLYNGKELQDGLGQYDYGARLYDPVIGRWGVVDPLASALYEISPYVYVRNNPILRIDRHGLWDITVHAYKDRGKYGYGTAVLTDRHGNEVYTFQVRLEGIGGRDRSKRGADTPLGVYDIPDQNMWISGGSRGSYGPNPRLALTPESGEILESGRDLIRIHGGRQEVYDSKTGLWKPVKNPELKKTEGCLRCSDINIKALKEITDKLMKNDKEEKGGKLTVLDDLEETFVPGPVPFVGGVKYTRPDENASKAEWDKWSQLLKSIFGQ